MVKSGQSVTVDFTTADPTTGAAADADSTPVATLVVNGTDDAATVTVTNKATGVYKAAVTLPTLAAGDVVSIRVAATVATVAGVGVVWTDVADTKRVSDLRDEVMRGTDGALLAVDYIAPDNASVGAIKAKTDNLPSAPAATGDAMTLTPEYDHAKDDVLTPLAAVDGKVDAILAEDVGADLGTDVCTITLRDESGNAVADARVYVSSDKAGVVRSDIRVTNALGQVAFDLTAGETYYLWAYSTRVDFTASNPMAFVAVAD